MAGALRVVQQREVHSKLTSVKRNARVASPDGDQDFWQTPLPAVPGPRSRSLSMYEKWPGCLTITLHTVQPLKVLLTTGRELFGMSMGTMMETDLGWNIMFVDRHATGQ